MSGRTRRSLRLACLAWAAAWGLWWLITTVATLRPGAPTEPLAYILYRTGALLAAWAGFSAYKALAPPDE